LQTKGQKKERVGRRKFQWKQKDEKGLKGLGYNQDRNMMKVEKGLYREWTDKQKVNSILTEKTIDENWIV